MLYSYTKGFFTKELKKMGVRQGDTSDGRTVKLEHLKYPDLVNLYFETLKREEYENVYAGNGNGICTQ